MRREVDRRTIKVTEYKCQGREAQSRKAENYVR